MKLPFKKKLFEKKLRKSLVVSKIVLTFASAFENESIEEEFFERFRYEQASSTILTKVRNRNRQ